MEEKTIRRNLRGASMTGDLPLRGLKHSLESVKKTHQVAGVGGPDAPLTFQPQADFELNRICRCRWPKE
jgi:hypothetical protein